MPEVTNDIDRARHQDLTVEEIRACPAFAHFTDEQAQEVVETIKLFAKIAYDSYKKDAQNIEK
jgi:hypothetical protein